MSHADLYWSNLQDPRDSFHQTPTTTSFFRRLLSRARQPTTDYAHSNSHMKTSMIPTTCQLDSDVALEFGEQRSRYMSATFQVISYLGVLKRGTQREKHLFDIFRRLHSGWLRVDWDGRVVMVLDTQEFFFPFVRRNNCSSNA